MGSAEPQTKPKRKTRFYLVLAVVALLIAIISIVVFLGLFQTSYGPGPVDIEVTTEKAVYLQGEEVYFVIYVNNSQNWPVPYPNSVGYIIEKEGRFISGTTACIDYAAGRVPTFPAHSRTLYNPPLLWNQKMDLNGTFVQVEPGNYTVSISFSGFGYSNSGNCTLKIR